MAPGLLVAHSFGPSGVNFYLSILTFIKGGFILPMRASAILPHQLYPDRLSEGIHTPNILGIFFLLFVAISMF